MVGSKVGWEWKEHCENKHSGFYQKGIHETGGPVRYIAVAAFAANISNIFIDFRYEVGLHNVTESIGYDSSATEEPYNQAEIKIKRRLNVLSFSVGIIF